MLLLQRTEVLREWISRKAFTYFNNILQLVDIVIVIVLN